MTQFLNHLAVQRNVAASTQTPALNAIVFLYRDVLVAPLGEMGGLNRVQQRKRIPVVMAASEVSAVLSQMSGMTAVMAQLMFGSGLRVEEYCTLRIKDIDFVSSTINVRDGKGGKDRATVLPSRLQAELQAHIMQVAKLHADGRTRGAGLAPLPNALERKHPKASESLTWQFRVSVFCVSALGAKRAPRLLAYSARYNPACLSSRCVKSGNFETRYRSYASAFVCNSIASLRDGHSNHSTLARSP